MIWDISDNKVGISDLQFDDKCLILSKGENGNLLLSVEVRKKSVLDTPAKLLIPDLLTFFLGSDQCIPAEVLKDSGVSRIERIGESLCMRFSFYTSQSVGISVTVNISELKQAFAQLFEEAIMRLLPRIRNIEM